MSRSGRPLAVAACLGVIGILPAKSSATPQPEPATQPATSQPTPSAPATSAPRVSNDHFRKLEETTIAIQKSAFRDVARKAEVASATEAARVSAHRQQRSQRASLSNPAINQATSVTAIELATAALQTSVDGAEAGISVAPLALMGFDKEPHQINMTVAALEDLKTRYGASYAYHTAWRPLLPADIGLAPCEFDEKREKNLRDAIRALRVPFEEACKLVAEIEATQGRKRTPLDIEAAAVCGVGAAEVREMRMSDAIARIDKVISAAQNQLAACSTLEALGLECRLRQIQPSLEALRAFKEPPPDCYSNGEIESKYAQANWDVPRYAVGVGGSVELFPQIFGFNADPDAKSLSRFQLRAEAARVTGWFEVRAGLNFGRARANPDDPALRSFIAPSVSFAVAVASLSSDSLYKDNKLNLVNGTPPPRLSLGFDAQFEYGLDRPETQVTGFQKVVLTAFADFRFTDTLGFRLGIPLSGALVTRDADTTKDPPVTEQSDLQWKVPVFVTTVLKM